jgi:hypothetical protein
MNGTIDVLLFFNLYRFFVFVSFEATGMILYSVTLPLTGICIVCNCVVVVGASSCVMGISKLSTPFFTKNALIKTPPITTNKVSKLVPGISFLVHNFLFLHRSAYKFFNSSIDC